MTILVLLLLLYLVALVLVLRDDRPRAVPRSRYCEAVTAHQRWERV